MRRLMLAAPRKNLQAGLGTNGPGRLPEASQQASSDRALEGDQGL